MIIIPSNVMAAPSDPFFSNTVLLLKTVGVGGASNSAFRDDSANNFVPVRNGDVTQGGLSPYVPTGYWSGYFDGTGDYLTLPGSSALQLAAGDFTIECWVMKTSTSSVNMLVWGGGGAGGANDAVIYTGGANDLVYYANGTSRINGGTLVNGRWHHVAVVRSSGVTKMYLDGTQVGSSYTDTNNYTANTLTVGWTSSTWNGNMSNLRIVKGSAVYTSNFTPPAAPLTAISGTSLLTLQDNRFIDRSSNNFVLTRNGDVSVQRFAPFPISNTVTTNLAATGSVTFDGNGDALTVPGTTPLQLSGDFTIETWFNSASVGFYPTIFSTVANYYTANGLRISTGPNNNTLYVATAGTNIIIASTAFQNGRWNHVALVRSGTTMTLYLNGVSVGSASTSTSFTADTFSIGTTTNSGEGGYWFNGQLSNFRVVKGSAAYTANFTPPTTPLTAITGTSLLTCQDSSTVTDASTNNFTITRVGDAKASEVSPFKRSSSVFGGSAYFDGSGDYLNFTNNVAFNQTADFSMDCWVYCTGNTANGTYQYFGCGDGNPYIELGLNGSGFFVFAKGYYPDLITSNGQAGVARAGQWYHVAATRVSNVCRLFVNGVLQGTATDSSSMAISGNNPFQVGAIANGVYPFTGYIAGFRFVRGGIPSAFSTTSTTAGAAVFTPPTSPPSLSDGLTGGSVSLLLNFDNAGITDATAGSVSRTVGDAKTSTAVTLFGNRVIEFDGSGDYLTLPITSQLQIGSGDMTYEAWVNPTQNRTQNIYCTRTGNDFTGWVAYLLSSGQVGIVVPLGGGWDINNTSGTGATVPAGTWTHVAITKQNTTWRCFIGGVLSWTATASTATLTQSTSANVGADYSGTNPFIGFMSDVRITRAARYTANFTPPTTELPTR